MKKKLRKLIAEGKTEQAIQLLLTHTNRTDLHLRNQVITLSSRYKNYDRKRSIGLLSRDDDKTTLADINYSLLLIVEKLDEIKEKLPEKESPESSYQSTELKKEPESKKDTWKIIGYIALIMGILAAVAEFSGYSIRDIFEGDNEQPDSFSVTVLVHGKEGQDHIILENQGEVILDIGSTRKRANIEEKGEATFKELPGKYEGEMALISVAHPQPYFPVDRDKEYQLTPDKIVYLEVELTGLNKIKGQVIDFDSEDPLDSVRVSVENVATHTDEFGWFELDIPQEKQAKFLRVNFFKKGYKMESLNDIAPHTNQDIEIALHKK